ncbi:DUF3293 domain-containing protein [Luteimonas terricola]|uniref:DUF3293 domain-containing protein n=1 Tax=Luteimonas terricola TaxID=645597 RepID=A0ABQ2EDN4_9GAMM|nr:DUF3293 domain-containing protein [Luteimonas terricola]GGK04628.1 hypothetical protein GCM10011394_12130 [Luteimonas terricola]
MPTQPPAVPEAEVQRLATAYLEADYRWARDGDWHDIHIGLPVPGLELLHPRVRSFGLLSAWNPYSKPREESANRRADVALETELATRDLKHIPAFSSAANRSWREPGWVIFDITAAELDHLRREFGQLGALWWQRGSAVRLRMQSTRPSRFHRDAPVDWLE